MLDGWRAAAGRIPWLLSVLRLVLAPLYVVAPEMSATLPLELAVLAAVSDFVDGRIARRLGVASRQGAVLDVVGDGAFVLAGLATLAAAGVISWVLPIATLCALAGLALALRRLPRVGSTSAAPRVRGPADRAGHAAGIANYATVIAGSVVLAGWVRGGWLVPVSVAVALLNLAPLLLRALGRDRPA